MKTFFKHTKIEKFPLVKRVMPLVVSDFQNLPTVKASLEIPCIVLECLCANDANPLLQTAWIALCSKASFQDHQNVEVEKNSDKVTNP